MKAASYLRGSDARETLMTGGLGAVLLLHPDAADGRFSLVEHALAPHALGAPVHTHRNEDEYSLVLDGRVGVEVGDETFEASAGDVIVKPRGVRHAFWNPTGTPARLRRSSFPAASNGTSPSSARSSGREARRISLHSGSSPRATGSS